MSNIDNMREYEREMKSRRSGEIDFLRFVFAIVIVIHHFNSKFHVFATENGYSRCHTKKLRLSEAAGGNSAPYG